MDAPQIRKNTGVMQLIVFVGLSQRGAPALSGRFNLIRAELELCAPMRSGVFGP